MSSSMFEMIVGTRKEHGKRKGRNLRASSGHRQPRGAATLKPNRSFVGSKRLFAKHNDEQHFIASSSCDYRSYTGKYDVPRFMLDRYRRLTCHSRVGMRYTLV